MTDKTSGRPAHMRNTGAYPTGPLREALLKAGHPVPEPAPKPANPHVVADGTKIHTWPTDRPAGPAIDPSPTGVRQVLRSPAPPPVAAADLPSGAAKWWVTGLLAVLLLVAATGTAVILLDRAGVL